jgi:very-short-patch-repair endonuclease
MAQPDLTRLDDSIADALYAVSAHHLPNACVALGLPPGDGNDAFASKRVYVKNRLVGKSQQELVELGARVLEAHPNYHLEEALWKLTPPQPTISDLTRRKLIDALARLPMLTGELRVDEFFGQIWPLDKLTLPELTNRSVLDGIFQHMIRNDDWSYDDLFSAIGLMHVSQQRFFKLLELLVHPTVRHDADQEATVTLVNSHVERDGLKLVPSDVISGYQAYALAPARGGVAGQAKNLIFASVGPKPEIVFVDAINNDIRIVKHSEHCLVYTNPIPAAGMRWRDLVAWWADLKGLPPAERATAVDLYLRLEKSLGSPPEKLLFVTYFERFHKSMGDALPALIPQVYLHYDPYTLRELREKRLLRQRMDFLVLLGSGQRIVIEVDGQQHYSDSDGPSPRLYAEMASADRDLKLAGYDVYRFGGYELQGEHGKDCVAEFFKRLFNKYAIGPTAAGRSGPTSPI